MAQLPCIGLSWLLTKPPFGSCAIYFHYGVRPYIIIYIYFLAGGEGGIGGVPLDSHEKTPAIVMRMVIWSFWSNNFQPPKISPGVDSGIN